jgi:hypothetical protein
MRDEVVELMTSVINKMNRETGAQHNMPSDVIEEQIAIQKDQLDRVNGLLFDTLLEHGYINTNR